jgi:PTH1 family peptidyl-tRNA hydrolase
MIQFLVVGLGNPGRRYARSPHNIGFMVVERLAERESIRMNRKECQALVGSGEIQGTPALLAEPQTYMNLSGVSVRSLMEKYSFTAQDLIVIYDDHDLPWTALRIRPSGSAGGHHGMESVIASLGATEFVRMRVGISPGSGKADPQFLLKPFRREHRKPLGDLLDYAAQAVASIMSEGVEKAMTKFNRRAPGSQSEEE